MVSLLSVQEALSSHPEPHKLSVVVHAYNPSTQEVETRGSEVQEAPRDQDPVSKPKTKQAINSPFLNSSIQDPPPTQVHDL